MKNENKISLKKPLGLFSLVMINVIAVDNLRSLTAGAEYGFALIFFYLIASLFFFLPLILVSAELATGWPSTGGAYIWIREAFGTRVGFFAIWLQWIYNVVWYPTIFTFIGGLFAYLILPQLVNNKFFMVGMILSLFWGVTFINYLGIKASSWVSTVGALIGTLLPMILIIILGYIWIDRGKPSQIQFSLKSFFPSFSDFNNLAFLTNVFFGLMGIEMSAVHAGDVKNPRQNYPRALFLSAIIILITLIFSCLAIAIVIPQSKLNLVSGFMDAFHVFFNAYHLTWLTSWIALFVIMGSLSGASAWIIGSARGLFIASQDNQLPAFLTHVNKKNMPTGILLMQGLIVTVLCLLFLIMPSMNSAYWVLANLTAQLALLFYILVFAASIRLRYQHAKVKRAFHIPGGLPMMWAISGVGMITCFFAILIGFLPPTQIAIGGIAKYEIVLSAGILLCCLPPFLWKTTSEMTTQ